MKPNKRPQADKERMIDLLIESGLWKNRKVTRVSVIGARAYYRDSMGKKGKNDRGIYDDAFFVISPECFVAFNGNTDPSIHRKGSAFLQAPQRVTYKPGYHGYNSRSGHPAFRQASDVIVIRDGKTGNGTALGDGRFTDRGSSRFWINLHRGGRTTTSSAGCQTVPPDQWGIFYSLIRTELKKSGQADFSYFLIEA
jgi:lysozyme